MTVFQVSETPPPRLERWLFPGGWQPVGSTLVIKAGGMEPARPLSRGLVQSQHTGRG